MGSVANVTTTNNEISPGRLKLGGTDLGGTLGGIKLVGTIKKANIINDQTGETVNDRRISGYEFSLSTILSEIKDKDTWAAVYAHAKHISAGNGAIYFDEQIGASDLDKALTLLIHPLSIDDDVLDFDHTFYKVVPDEVAEVEYGPTKQQGLKVTFHVYRDTTTSPARFWFHGDPANGLVAATAGAPSAGSNTGTGAITAQVPKSKTVTETVTVVCTGIGDSSANIFKVSGSVSGILGEISLAAASTSSVDFACSVVGFTITQDTTQFVLGDSFTIAMTAANYA